VVVEEEAVAAALAVVALARLRQAHLPLAQDPRARLLQAAAALVAHQVAQA
jgi:hypothetical protein